MSGLNNDNRSTGPVAGTRTISLKMVQGQLVAQLENGSTHPVYVRVAGDEVAVGCIRTNRKAIEMIQNAIKTEEAFQKKNCRRLMANLHRKKANV